MLSFKLFGRSPKNAGNGDAAQAGGGRMADAPGGDATSGDDGRPLGRHSASYVEQADPWQPQLADDLPFASDVPQDPYAAVYPENHGRLDDPASHDAYDAALPRDELGGGATVDASDIPYPAGIGTAPTEVPAPAEPSFDTASILLDVVGGPASAAPDDTSVYLAIGAEDEQDDVEDTTSSWIALDGAAPNTCPSCGAEVGFARRCPACGAPMFSAPAPIGDEDEFLDDEAPEGGDTGLATDEAADAPVPADSADVSPDTAPTTAPGAQPRSSGTAALAETAASPSEAPEMTEQERLIAAAREIRAQAAEEQVAAVQSRLLRDKRLMAEIDKIMREEDAGSEAPEPQPQGTAAPDARLSAPSAEAPMPHPATAERAASTERTPIHHEGAIAMAEPTPFTGAHANPGFADPQQQPPAQRAMRIMSGEAARAGSFADIANAMTINGRTIIDFFLIDRPEVEPGVDEAVHQARVIMQPDAVVALRDMLTEHIERFYQRA